jgi:SnoaL-like domain
MSADAFKQAVASGEIERIGEILADDVVFRSPAVFKPYEGREATMFVLRAVSRVLEDFEYVDRFEGADGELLLFSARVGDRRIDGIDLLRFDDQGKVRELTVMMRPLTGLQAVVEAMGRELQQAGVEASG